MNNLVIVNQSGGKYLFSVPESVELKKGDAVKCDTKRGVTDGVCWQDSFTAEDATAQIVGKLLGAKFPLKSVVGKAVTLVEMFNKPTVEDKPEPPKHQYKVGDNVKVIGNTECTHFLEIGDIGTIVSFSDSGRAEVKTASHLQYVAICDIEPYTEPKYYSGKVVCVAKEYKCFWPIPDFTVGKVYNVVDGAITDDTGYRSMKCTTLEDICTVMGNAFIPYLGEA